ncbi:MAG: cell division protein ZapA [Bdellovibrionaceae bacterium]|nr:cell division protein ZapA [Pseudobdellovibrionaceae bacterium]
MNSYNVEFQSESFKLVTDHDPTVFKALKLEVESKLKEIQNSHKRISIEKALFLTCLYLAEDKFFLKKAIDKNINQIESQAKSILTDLEVSNSGFKINL